MIKNEEKRILVSLNSIKDLASSVIIYDTGSTDNTLSLVRKWSLENNIPCHIKEDVFVDFSFSRNKSLDFADTFSEIDYLLLMDCNDELVNGKLLKMEAERYLKYPFRSAFMLCQNWIAKKPKSSNKYFNIRFIKPRCNWRYKGVVHEYIFNDNKDHKPIKLDPSIMLVQDREQDNYKSIPRYEKDKELLLKEYQNNPEDTRTVFYLAQTYRCLGDQKNAVKYYSIRSRMKGFKEEVFQSFLNCANLSNSFTHWSIRMNLYLEAYNVIKRAEPLIKIASYYKNIKNFDIAYIFIRLACDLKYPKDSILFVEKSDYDYLRWHIMGIVSYYAGKKKEGIVACKKAIEAEGRDIDRKNLKCYYDDN